RYRSVRSRLPLSSFHDTAPPDLYPLSLHDALPIFHRLLPGAHQVDGGAVLVRGAADDRRAAVPAQGETRGVGGVEARRGELVLAALEALTAPDAELVAVLVVEPPDPLTVRREHAVRGAVGPMGHLSLLTGRPVPGIQL